MHILAIFNQTPKEQAKIDMYLDWHHSGARMVFPQLAFSKIYGQPSNEELQVMNKKVESGLDTLEIVFLGGE